MKNYFIDTSFFIALEIENDSNHQKSKLIWEKILLSNDFHFITTSYIFDEVVTYLNNRGFHKKAVILGNNILESSHITFIQIEEKIFESSWKTFQKYKDKKFSFTDCVSFNVMKENKLKLALSFDGHFIQAGFTNVS